MSTNYEIIYPDETGTLSFSTKQKILLACPNEDNEINISLESEQIVEATCVRNKTFKVNSKNYLFSSLTCKKPFKSTYNENGTCLNQFSQIEIGFGIRKAFIPILKICRDNKTHETYYVKAEMSESIAGHQIKSTRPNWVSHDLFPGHSINSLYKKKHQLQIMGMILNSQELAEEYLKKNQLTRGHLAAKADFVYNFEQNATFTFANAAPQWNSFNARNWEYVESHVRDFIVENNLNVTIYTGVHGQMTLRDAEDEEQLIFLDLDENNGGYIRVPNFFWKIVYDPARYEAIAIIGTNDPFSKEINDDMFLCPDISDSPDVAWLTKSWKNRKDIWSGLSYVCLYDELKEVVPIIPDIKVKGILSGFLK